ncbi:ATP synthase F1 subunit delta [Ureaplasma canigenitalium]|uniref:ATP synthase F1 subunit delta n=1 Tax=Ureaplasma canigenitalium TaxID=42092 RepID=UPI0004E1DEB6|nr:ATP synthase F1 subunit delta [Ureaplasma canigenitalium]
MKKTKIVEKYSYALFELARDQGKVEKYLIHLETIKEAFKEAPGFYEYIQEVDLDKEVRKKEIKAIFENEIEEYLLNFLLLLIDRDLFRLVKDILTKSIKLLNNELKLVEIEITTAFELTKDQETRLLESLEKKYSVKFKPTFIVDKNIIGGIVVTFNSNTIDNSVIGKLKAVFQQEGINH